METHTREKKIHEELALDQQAGTCDQSNCFIGGSLSHIAGRGYS